MVCGFDHRSARYRGFRHHPGFRLFWRSRPLRAGRPKITKELRGLIQRMRTENPTWGAPRIHGELRLLGFDISEPTVSRYLQRLKRTPQESKTKQWLAFLNNHREVIAAFDFFTFPTLYFRTLYCFFVTSMPAVEFCSSSNSAVQCYASSDQ
jgi:putative transposase